MNHLISSFPRLLLSHFSGQNLLWNIVAIVLTYLLVVNGIDWYYFINTQEEILHALFLPAIVLGGILPIVAPLSLIVSGSLTSRLRMSIIGWTLAQAVIAGSLISSTYKAFTGRIQPNLADLTTNITGNFNFGFWNHGIFWGWPSSHTTIAFAMAVALISMFPEKKKLIFLAMLYALYVGIGVSFSIHWFSDFVAGAIIGTVIGMNVGRNWKEYAAKPQ